MKKKSHSSKPRNKSGSPVSSSDRVLERSQLPKEAPGGPSSQPPRGRAALLAGATTLELPPLSLVVYIVIISLRDCRTSPFERWARGGGASSTPPPSPERLLGGECEVVARPRWAPTEPPPPPPASLRWEAIGASSGQAPPSLLSVQ